MRQLFTFIFAVLLLVGIFFPIQSGAQLPDKMSYQAVIRNSSGELVQTKKVSMKISILYGKSKKAVYVEIHTPTTNSNGLVTLEIGGGETVSGVFANIDWAKIGHYYLKTETDINGGRSYGITSLNQLLSVPFAFHAKTAGSIAGVRKHIPLSIFSAFLEDGANFTVGMVGGSGLNLPDKGVPAFSLSFNLPDDYIAGDTIYIRMIGTSNGVGDIIINANATTIARPQVGYITGEHAGSGLSFDKISITTANMPIETMGYLVSPDDNKQLLPGDAVILSVFRRGSSSSDSNKGYFRIHSIEIRY